MTTNRSMRVAAYTCGLALGVLLVAATVAKAEEFASCTECRTFYANKAVGKGGICENNPTKGCVEPYVSGACTKWCTKDPATTVCSGMAEEACAGYDLPNPPLGPCTTETDLKWCGDSSGNNYCRTIAIDVMDVRPSPCYYTCKCFTP